MSATADQRPPTALPRGIATGVARAIADAAAELPPGTQARIPTLRLSLPPDPGPEAIADAVRAALAEAMENGS